MTTIANPPAGSLGAGPAPVAVQRRAANHASAVPLDLPAYPPVSVFMAVRDEAADLAASIRRIFEQDYPGELEVVLAVAPSRDNTWGVAQAIAESEPRLRVLANPAATTPHGLNAAIASARHEYLVRVDGHAFLPPRYLRDVVRLLVRTEAANVGGRMLPLTDGPVSGAIALAMSSRVGIGGGAFHVGGLPGAQATVYLGAFRRDAITSVGGYDEYFLRAQDWELNHRLRAAGHTIWFDPALGVGYRPRARWRDFARQQYRTGGWRRRVIERHRRTASARYLAPPLAVLAILLGVLTAAQAPLLADWLLIGLAAPLGYVSAVLALGLFEARRLPWRTRLRVPVALALMHLSWGTGFLVRAR